MIQQNRVAVQWAFLLRNRGAGRPEPSGNGEALDRTTGFRDHFHEEIDSGGSYLIDRLAPGGDADEIAGQPANAVKSSDGKPSLSELKGFKAGGSVAVVGAHDGTEMPGDRLQGL